MFRVALQESLDRPLYFQQVVVVDSLYEAELMALKLATQRFNNANLVIVHRGNLVYDIYEVAEPVGRVQIKSV